MSDETLRLQLNNTGAWKQLLEFPAENLARVRAAAGHLAGLAYPKFTLRIVDREGKVLTYWSPGQDWYQPHTGASS